MILSENSDLDLAGLDSNSHKSRGLVQGQGRQKALKVDANTYVEAN